MMMAGHSKWENIKRRKARVDAQKVKYLPNWREIIVAAKEGGLPFGCQLSLRLATKAKEANMPNDNISRAIQKGSGEGETLVLEQLYYEGYGPGGSSLLEIMTDNRNRTAAEIGIFSPAVMEIWESGCNLLDV